jgi:hypothetical protein
MSELPDAWQLLVTHKGISERLVELFDVMGYDLVPAGDVQAQMPRYYLSPRLQGQS